MSRWKFYDPALLWLFPVTYFVHLLEEWFARAPIVLWGVQPDRPLGVRSFLLWNAIGLILMITGVRLVRRGHRFHWIVPALATAVLLNSMGHLVGSFAARRYSSGLATAIVLWVPLALLTLVRVWDQTSGRTLRIGLIVGITIEVIVVLVLRVIGRSAIA